MDQCQGIVGEARAAKQLEQRAADHEREVGGSTASGLSCVRIAVIIAMRCSRRVSRPRTGAMA